MNPFEVNFFPHRYRFLDFFYNVIHYLAFSIYGKESFFPRRESRNGRCSFYSRICWSNRSEYVRNFNSTVVVHYIDIGCLCFPLFCRLLKTWGTILYVFHVSMVSWLCRCVFYFFHLFFLLTLKRWAVHDLICRDALWAWWTEITSNFTWGFISKHTITGKVPLFVSLSCFFSTSKLCSFHRMLLRL